MTKRRWIALGTAVGIVLAAVVTTAFVVGGDEGHVADNPVMVASPTTDAPTTKKKKVTTTTVKLPVPDPAPADPYENVPVTKLGVIEIPKINLQHEVFEGIWLTVLDVGPGHWPGSAMPCETGNSVFPGHRTTYSWPFHDIDKLAPGDQIIYHLPERSCVYEVTETHIVYPTDLWVIEQSYEKTTTIIVCHPKGSAAQRIVVKGKLIADIPVELQTEKKAA